MTVLSGRRYRVDFTSDQATFAENIGTTCRSVWNTALEQRRLYGARGSWISYREQARQLADAKASFPWLAQPPSHTLQQTLMDLDKACTTHGTWNVRWRSARSWSPSFRFPDPAQITVQPLNHNNAQVKLPKFGWVRIRWSRPLGGIRSATIRRESGRWWISILVADPDETPEIHAHPQRAVGVDRGVKTLAVTSCGEFYDQSYASPREIEHCKDLQRRVAGTEKGLNRRKAAVARLNRTLGRVRRRRQDFTTKVGRTMARGNSLVVFEALRIKNMTASAAGTPDQPGRRVRQKSGLNRAILDKGWHRLEAACRSAARRTGSRVVTINPAYTSITCSSCRHVDRRSRESQADFRCTACGYRCHADVNAAVNILTAGRAELGHETRERELGRANPDNRGRKAQRQPTAAQRFSPIGLVEIPRCIPREDVNRG
ncbi:putative transposase [Saccharothrix ecbatanensis]|uniref:Putative transposase n=1 Tax=Saccharothrix ecbatanensis TaxID=1105145 RepID=A0A7W9HGE5_9PSEU|nr:RNA-guided endonuclease TnpB family protein [Saccharothrix ecbatanensis]MBB5801787.1 putative transposase [Saccharothrix ecbatanensis]